MSVVNTNVSALIGLNNMRLTNLGLRTSLARLSSGLKINWASDDPSGLAIAKGMEAQIGGIRMATQNAQDGINLIHTADGALSETQDILLRMRDLAVRAANEATLTSADRYRLQSEFASLRSEISRKAYAVTFNTKNIFGSGTVATNTRYSTQMLQIGPDNGVNFKLTVYIKPVTAATCGGVNLNVQAVSSVARAQSAIGQINSAINQVSEIRSSLGVAERRVTHIVDDLAAQDVNISAAKSRIMDADMAAEITEFTRLQILQQTGTAILAQANAQPQSVLQLLQ